MILIQIAPLVYQHSCLTHVKLINTQKNIVVLEKKNKIMLHEYF